MPSDDRDQKFERALAQHLRGGPSQAHCPDAETLAAYHERNLSLEEMARWKQHISTCSVCQEALALVETTENQLVEEWKDQEVPVQQAVSLLAAGEESSLKGLAKATPAASGPVPMRRRPALLRWAVPLGAVAAGVLVFIGLYEQRMAKVALYSDMMTARRQEPAAPGAAFDQTQNKVQPHLESKDERAATAEMSDQNKEKDLRAAPVPKPAERTRAEDRALTESERQTVGEFRKKAQTPPPPPPSADILAQADRDTAVSANAPAVAAAPRPAPPPATMAYGRGTGGA
ncbi:MAG TPA: hypothetical protein VFI45_14730, partial [Candidatus Acidoferrum sp.]|nr:hypothetical protein [Candidatus Acidoferrum sp.]